MSSILRAYSHLLRKYPLTVQSLQTGTLMGAGDVLSQVFVEKKSVNEYKWQHTARFFALGVFMITPALTTWYGILHRKIGSGKGLTAIKKVALDQGLFAPSFLGVFLTVLGLVQGNTFEHIREDLKKNYRDILLANWSVWPAVQIVNFNFVPLHHQVLVVQTFALLWNTYLAWKTNRDVTHDSPQSLIIVRED